MLNVKTIIGLIASLFIFISLSFSAVAQEKTLPKFIAPSIKATPELSEAAPRSLAKEVYEIMIAQSKESAQEAVDEKVYYKNEALSKYQTILNNICAQFVEKKCPDLYFSKREIVPGAKAQTAAMLPIGLMALNEESVGELDINQVTFIIAHEYSHYYYNHSLKRINAAAKSVWDHSIMLTEPEKIFMVIPMLPGMRDFLQNVEQEADDFGLAYLKHNGMTFDCKGMYKTLLGGRKESTDKHKSTEDRCSHMH